MFDEISGTYNFTDSECARLAEILRNLYKVQQDDLLGDLIDALDNATKIVITEDTEVVDDRD